MVDWALKSLGNGRAIAMMQLAPVQVFCHRVVWRFFWSFGTPREVLVALFG